MLSGFYVAFYNQSDNCQNHSANKDVIVNNVIFTSYEENISAVVGSFQDVASALLGCFGNSDLFEK